MNRTAELNTRRISALSLILVAILCTFFPTSIGGSIAVWPVPIGTFLCALLLFMTTGCNKLILHNVFLSSILFLLLLMFTLVSPLEQIAFGAISPYIGLVAVMSLRLKPCGMTASAMWVFIVFSAILLILGWGTVLSVDVIRSVIKWAYQMYYEELFERMVDWYSKPVSVYATHSVAAFVYFFMSLTYFRLASVEVNKAMRWLFFAIGFAFTALIPFLASNSAFLLLVILIALLPFYLIFAGHYKTLAAIIAIGLCSVIALLYANVFDYLNQIFRILEVLNSADNGLVSRIGSDSRLAPTYEYLANNYLLPVGLRTNDIMQFGDNFITEYIIRISPLGYLIVLVMLYLFLKANLTNKLHILLFFIFILLSDTGYPLLTTFKFIFLLPIFIVLWNHSGESFSQLADNAG